MFNTFDITISGTLIYEIRYPNGGWRWLSLQEDGIEFAWHAYKSSITKTINLLNVESFESIECPIAEFTWTGRRVSWLKKFWWEGFYNDRIWKLDVKVIGEKSATIVKMRSGEKFIIDESAECLKNAIDSSVWSAIIKDDLK